MEYLWRYPHGLMRVDYVHEQHRPSSFVPETPGGLDRSHRRLRLLLMAAAVAGFIAHILVLAFFQSQHEGRFLSNLLQFVLGLAGFLAMLDAGNRSQRAARWIWYYAAAAVGAYTAGQLLFIGYALFAHGPRWAPRITDQFFFFWVVPLLAAGALDTLRRQDGFDLTVLLDFAQFVILGLALHLSVFGDASRWQSHPRDMEFLKVKVRVLRDALVLAWLWGRAWLTSSSQLRKLFIRLGCFYLAYSVSDAIYLYFEAARQVAPGTWFDLLWSAPRLLAVALAFTWNWQEENEPAVATQGHRGFFLKIAPVIVPLALLAISFRTFSAFPVRWAILMVVSFAIASTRLLVMQARQDRTLADLHTSNELLHSIVEGTSEAIYLKDREGRYKLINQAGARYLGRKPEEVLGKTDRQLLSPETLGTILRADGQVLNRGESVTCEERLIEEGVARTFLSTKNPYRDSEGRVTGVLGISVEITQHRRMEEELRRIQRMESIGAFSGAIAHDFSNVLTVIKGYSQLTQSGLKNQPALQENLAQVVKATDRAAALIRQLLAFSRQQELQPRVIGLNDIISHIRKMLQRLIGDDVHIVTRLSDELWPVKADPGQMEQVLMNLAANARDAMPHGGKLVLETANVHVDEADARANLNVQAGDFAMFAVSDTGMGMDAQTLARIFEPFFTTKPNGKGTGLGLATAYGIVKQSGGYISVESEPGAGATFKIYLPRVDQPIEYQIQGPSSHLQQNYGEAI